VAYYFSAFDQTAAGVISAAWLPGLSAGIVSIASRRLSSTVWNDWRASVLGIVPITTSPEWRIVTSL
jgi:hypothetical protein